MEFAPFYPLIHQVLKPVFPDCLWAGCSKTPKVALTFDDGPHPHHTPQLLDVLEKHGVSASFFWLGTCVNRSPQVAKRVFDQGHWIGLHGYTHRSFPTFLSPELKHSLEQTQLAIAHACDLDLAYVQANIRDVRPPNGFFTPKILKQLQEWRYRPVMWSVVPEDWVSPGIEIATQRVLSQTDNGSLIVLHDGYCGGQDVAAIVDQIIPRLQQQNFEFVSVEQLWQTAPVSAPHPIVSWLG